MERVALVWLREGEAGDDGARTRTAGQGGIVDVLVAALFLDMNRRHSR